MLDSRSGMQQLQEYVFVCVDEELLSRETERSRRGEEGEEVLADFFCEWRSFNWPVGGR